MNEELKWNLVITPRHPWFDFHFGDIWRYKGLIFLFIKRDFITFYKQTILGPAWFIIQPLLTTLVFTVIFGKVAKISTDGMPRFLFYLSGTVVWNYFATCLNQTSNTFVVNAGMFGKVYFPRLTVPISIVAITFVQFIIQFFLFLSFYIYYFVIGANIHPTMYIFLLPLIILQMAILGLGTGILVSSLTTKYRDLTFLMKFIIQLWMYVTPVVYPASIVSEKYRLILMLNPMTPIIESFRLALLGSGEITFSYISMSWCVTMIIFIAGIMLFNRIEKTFMDTV